MSWMGWVPPRAGNTSMLPGRSQRPGADSESDHRKRAEADGEPPSSCGRAAR